MIQLLIYIVSKLFYFTELNKQKIDSNNNEKYRQIEASVMELLLQKCTILSRILPGFLNIVSTKIKNMIPLINVSDEDDCFYSNLLQKNGIMNVHVCINAQTKIMHTEADSTMTVIGVPFQPDPNYGMLNPQFYFNVTKTETIVINMKEYSTFSFLGYMLNHQQVMSNNPNKNIFINIASYGNKRLFHNILKSIKRNLGIIES